MIPASNYPKIDHDEIWFVVIMFIFLCLFFFGGMYYVSKQTEKSSKAKIENKSDTLNKKMIKNGKTR